MEEELQLMDLKRLGPRISITKNKFTVEVPPGAEKYFDGKTRVLSPQTGEWAERGEADIRYVLSTLRMFLEQFK